MPERASDSGFRWAEADSAGCDDGAALAATRTPAGALTTGAGRTLVVAARMTGTRLPGILAAPEVTVQVGAPDPEGDEDDQDDRDNVEPHGTVPPQNHRTTRRRRCGVADGTAMRAPG